MKVSLSDSTPELAARLLKSRFLRSVKQTPPSRIEFNIQTSLWPQTKATRFSEQAHYLMRSFEISENRENIISASLENSPDVERIARDYQLRQQFLSWILSAENLRKIDVGGFVLPKIFLASKVTSIAPYGLARKSNRPFSSLVSVADLRDIDYDNFNMFRSPKALLRRLDTLSCVGCHQSRSIAGFHFLGFDRHVGLAGVATLKLPFSAHFSDMRIWRRQFLSSAKGQNLVIPSPDHFGETADGGEGDFCGLNGSGINLYHFRDWF
jgi:hypothetical protein